MTHRVLLQRIQENGYRATALLLPDCVGTGETRDEALANVTDALASRLTQGEIVNVEVGEPAHPWLPWFGMFADDPTFDDYLAEVAAYRQEVNVAEQDHAALSAGH